MRRTALLLSATIAVLVWLLAGCARYDLGQEALQEEPLGEATNGKIEFQTSGAIWAMNANGSDPRLLTKTVPDPGWSISPDGEKIAFAAERTEVDCGNNRGDCPEETTAQIYVMNADGSDKTKLLEDMGGSPPPDWSPDSKKIAFGLSDADARRCALYAMNANGWGDPIPLTNFDGCYSIESLAWSPNGKKIAVEILEEGNGYDNDIYVLDVPAEGRTSQPRQLTNGPHTWWNVDPTWSPDSTEIAYTHMNTAVFENQWSIYKMNADGSGKTRLAAGQVYYEPPNNPPPGPVAMDSPAWSPDGEKIAFVRKYPDESPTISSAIYEMKSDGSNDPTLIRRLQAEAVSNLEWLPHHVDLPLATSTTSAPSQKQQKAEHPIGKITFSSDRDGDNEIFKMGSDGTAVTQLTNNTAGNDLSPAWSPDGSKIAFVSSLAGNFDIHVMNADGSNSKQLTASPDNEWAPAWSPDGSKIAFERELPAGEGQVLPKIFLMDAHGSNQVQLRTETTFSEESPDWSPDGSKIVFVGVGGIAGGSHIYTMNVDGTGLTQLTENNFYTKASPDWSPDGSKILFGAYDSRAGGKYDVFVMNADGSGVQNLTNQPNSHDIQAVWSPDGREIALVRDQNGDCASTQDGTCEIWRMRSDGSPPTRVTSDTANDHDPDWKPIPQ